MAIADAEPENSIVVCHSEAGAWRPALYHTTECPPHGALYTIGRTMVHTHTLHITPPSSLIDK